MQATMQNDDGVFITSDMICPVTVAQRGSAPESISRRSHVY